MLHFFPVHLRPVCVAGSLSLATYGKRRHCGFVGMLQPCCCDMSRNQAEVASSKVKENTAAWGVYRHAFSRQQQEAADRRQLTKESAESITGYGQVAYGKAKLFKTDRHQISTDRKVIVLVGLTGSGKSSTGNTLCGARKAFAQGASVSSVTSAVSVRDYEFEGDKWRVIDTPGFEDTNLSAEMFDRELKELFAYARHGISCIMVTVRKGRFTPEQESMVRRVLDLFGGEDVFPFCMLVVTSCLDPVEKLRDDVAQLPPDHALRRLSEALNDRVLPIENIKDGHKTTSRFLLHHAVQELFETNEGAFKCDTQPLKGAGVSRPLSAEILSGMQVKHIESSWDPASRRQTIVIDYT